MKRLMAACRSTTEWNTPFFQAPLGELGEEALDGIEPRERRWNEVECPSRMPRQPSADFGLLVGRIIVEDDVDGLVGGQLSVNNI